MNITGILNWLLSAVIFAAGTVLVAFQIVPGMNWHAALATAGTTFIAALVQHLREHPFAPSV